MYDNEQICSAPYNWEKYFFEMPEANSSPACQVCLRALTATGFPLNRKSPVVLPTGLFLSAN